MYRLLTIFALMALPTVAAAILGPPLPPLGGGLGEPVIEPTGVSDPLGGGLGSVGLRESLGSVDALTAMLANAGLVAHPSPERFSPAWVMLMRAGDDLEALAEAYMFYSQMLARSVLYD